MKKHRRHYEQTNYWESTTDAIIGLFMIILLILLVLILLMLYSNTHTSNYDGDSESEYVTAYDETHVDDEEGDDWDHGGHAGGGYAGGGGYSGGDDGDERGDDGGETDWDGGYEFNEEGITMENGKCAVLVHVIDEESKALVREQGVTFELRDTKNRLISLNVYYPEKQQYKQYQTDAKGSFYLPEKVAARTYAFHQTTPIEGYDMVEGYEVTIDEEHDWDDPLVVNIPVSPSKNTILIEMMDADKNPVSGSFEVYAAEDVTTKDGTVRYKKDTKVAKISCDEQGLGESKELFLGDYVLKQTDIQDGYAFMEDMDVTVISKAQTEEHRMALTAKATTAEIHLTNEADESLPVAEAVFELSTKNGKDKQRFETGSDGIVKITGLHRGETYQLKQTDAADDYRPTDKKITFTVDEKGHIEDLTTYTIALTNRRIEAAFDIVDFILRRSVKGIEVTLTDESGKVLDQWTSEGRPHMITGLTPGDYILAYQNKQDTVSVKDTVGVQNIQGQTQSMQGMLAAGLILILIMLAGMAIFFRKKR